MDMEEMEEKRPRFLWIVVVAVVAAALTVFILMQSGRFKSKGAEVEPVTTAQEEAVSEPGWPAPETALSDEPDRPVEAATEPSEFEKPVPPAAAPKPITAERTAAKAESPRVRRDSAVAAPTSGAGRFVVQVGSYRDERIARIEADRMEQYGYRAWVESADVPGKGRFYRVRVGGFDTLVDARKAADSLSETLGASCWVDNR